MCHTYYFACSMFGHGCTIKLTFVLPRKLATCSPHTDTASLDIAKAYCNSPISPSHKKYLCMYWKNNVYVQHIAIEGLATAGGIQGTIANATVKLLKFHTIDPAIKWVDDFIFFWSSSEPVLYPFPPVFHYDLSTIHSITEPLGIPWHPITKKGHDFQSSFTYVGFCWDIPSRSVSLSSEKCLHLLSKVSSLLVTPPPHITKKMIASVHGSLQHMTVVYLQGHSHLAPLSSFLAKFPNDHVLHNIPNPTHTLVELPNMDLDLWVDTSTSWGLGLCIGNKWAAWQLLEGWDQCGRDNCS